MSEETLAPTIADPTKASFIRPSVTATNAAVHRTDIRVRQHEMIIDEPLEKGGTDVAPTPLETLLASLVGCEAAVTRIVAEAMRFSYTGLDFSCEGVADMRGARGVKGVRPYFQSVTLEIRLETDEPQRRIEMLKRNVEQRCPIMNLMKDAGVDLRVEWTASPAS